MLLLVLALGRVGIIRQGGHSGGEVLHLFQNAPGRQGLSEIFAKIQPLVGRIFQASVIQIEAIDVGNGSHCPPAKKHGPPKRPAHPTDEAAGEVVVAS